jgi:hypothetical protein
LEQEVLVVPATKVVHLQQKAATLLSLPFLALEEEVVVVILLEPLADRVAVVGLT